jgi:plastocyanin
MVENGSVRRVLLAVILASAVALLVVGVVRWRAAREPESLRTVVLSMRDYTFNGDNPTLSFHAGERVRFIVRNDETTPIRHNFAIPSLNVPCDRELGPGEIRHVILTLDRPGTYEYLCCTHRGMSGKLVVAGR